jgi:hypothetical protein
LTVDYQRQIKHLQDALLKNAQSSSSSSNACTCKSKSDHFSSASMIFATTNSSLQNSKIQIEPTPQAKQVAIDLPKQSIKKLLMPNSKEALSFRDEVVPGF